MYGGSIKTPSPLSRNCELPNPAAWYVAGFFRLIKMGSYYYALFLWHYLRSRKYMPNFALSNAIDA